MSGSTNIPGYSFKQKPIARMTAARTARVRSGIRSNVIRKIAPTLVATTGSSQFGKAYRTRCGGRGRKERGVGGCPDPPQPHQHSAEPRVFDGSAGQESFGRYPSGDEGE